MPRNTEGMKISLIAAMDKNRVIGKEGDMPWHLPDDLKYFQEKTMGHFLLMGRKTFHALKDILKGRKLLVVSRKKDFDPPQAKVVHGLEEGLVHARLQGEEELFVGGGGDIYRQTLFLADRLYITLIDAEFEGDTYFPEIDTGQWKLVLRKHHAKDEKHDHAFAFLVYERI